MEVLVKRVRAIPENVEVLADCREDPVFVWVGPHITDAHVHELQAELRAAVRDIPDRAHVADIVATVLRRHLPELIVHTDEAGRISAPAHI